MKKIIHSLRRPLYLMLALVLLCSHDLYLKMDSYFLQPNQEATISLYNGTFEKSENLILRIDGTTAGGPILDPETNQKAAGGTWKMIDDGNGNVNLRIRLVIPPKKERVIEMMGTVDRLGADLGSIPMASKAFGIPHLEALAAKSTKSDGTDEVMHCSGEVRVYFLICVSSFVCVCEAFLFVSISQSYHETLLYFLAHL